MQALKRREGTVIFLYSNKAEKASLCSVTGMLPLKKKLFVYVMYFPKLIKGFNRHHLAELTEV